MILLWLLNYGQMTEQHFSGFNLTTEQLGHLVKVKMLEALEEMRQIQVTRCIEIEKCELQAALKLTRQQVHNWCIDKKLHPTRESGIKKFYTEESIRGAIQSLSTGKRTKYTNALNEYIKSKYNIIIK
jgi:hypothetical protein